MDLINISSCNNLFELQTNIEPGFLSESAFRLMKETISDHVKLYLIENPYVDKDFRSTYYNDFSKRHQDICRDSYRIHLFGNNEEYYGFFTLRDTPPFNLGRAYISPKALSIVNGCMLCARYEVHLIGKTFFVDAFPWMQQDANISRCAQVSIWSIVRYYSERYSYYPEQTLQQIFDLASSYTRKIPSKGLTVENISNIFNSIGFSPEVYFSEAIGNRKLFNEVIYTFIESGIPFVAALTQKRHAITIIGHTDIKHGVDNQNIVTPVSELVEGYFTVDDNYMPYSIIGDKCQHALSDIDAVIVPLYEKMYLNVTTLLEDILPHLECALLPHKKMYRRFFITSSKSFKNFVFINSKDNSYKTFNILQKMPKFIWIAEYIQKDDYPDSVHTRFLFDATGMEYAEITKNIISAKIGDLLISNGATMRLHNALEPIYINNLRRL